MGQTLTHGVYLPDEGERNCYAGLAANWQLLDGAVGTVAEHTSQIAGKAPAVHTHTKSQITDFPAYGTTAGTICEGNDSRLSDARTPVAHTHTKSDVTDLLNSNLIPSANNSYDLGSASKQWLNTYSKGYYYNGVAWGLDKENTWSNYNIYSKGIELLGSRPTYILPEFSANASGLSILTNSYGKSVKFGTYTIDENNVVSLDTTLGFIEVKAGNNNNANLATIYPRNAVAAELGLSNRKWTAFNGVNPGALSLPDLTSNGYIELSDNISANTEYSYTPPANGWLALYVLTTGFHVENAVGIFNGSGSGNAHRLACSATSGINLARSNYYHGAVILPVIGGIPYLCWIKIDSSTTLASKGLYFYKATGNV